MCFSICVTLSFFSNSAISYVDAHPDSEFAARHAQKNLENIKIAIAETDINNPESSRVVPLGETTTATPNYMTTYFAVIIVELTVLSVLLFLTPIFVRVVLLRKGS